jgi:hypothetical protein
LSQRKRKKKAKNNGQPGNTRPGADLPERAQGRRYDFTAPLTPGGTWAATDKFGDHERLEAANARNYWRQSGATTSATGSPGTGHDVTGGCSWPG